MTSGWISPIKILLWTEELDKRLIQIFSHRTDPKLRKWKSFPGHRPWFCLKINQLELCSEMKKRKLPQPRWRGCRRIISPCIVKTMSVSPIFRGIPERLPDGQVGVNLLSKTTDLVITRHIITEKSSSHFLATKRSTGQRTRPWLSLVTIIGKTEQVGSY